MIRHCPGRMGVTQLSAENITLDFSANNPQIYLQMNFTLEILQEPVGVLAYLDKVIYRTLETRLFHVEKLIFTFVVWHVPFHFGYYQNFKIFKICQDVFGFWWSTLIFGSFESLETNRGRDLEKQINP